MRLQVGAAEDCKEEAESGRPAEASPACSEVRVNITIRNVLSSGEKIRIWMTKKKQVKTKQDIRGSFKTFAAFVYPILVPVEYIM